MFVDGRPVCDDDWDLADAGVVCGMLFQNGIAVEATRESRFGEVGEDFSMDEVACRGDETSLLQCGHETEDDCGGGEAAGVVCYSRGKTPDYNSLETHFYSNNINNMFLSSQRTPN